MRPIEASPSSNAVSPTAIKATGAIRHHAIAVDLVPSASSGRLSMLMSTYAIAT